MALQMVLGLLLLIPAREGGPAGAAAAWHPQAPLGLSEANGETTDAQEHLLQPEYLGFFWLCPPSLFPWQITARSHK